MRGWVVGYIEGCGRGAGVSFAVRSVLNRKYVYIFSALIMVS